MARAFAHVLGTVAMLLTVLLWVSLLNPHMADRLADKIAGAQNEYKMVLGAGLLAAGFSFAAAIRGARWWYVGVALSLGTLGFFTYILAT
jgi:hypothetical protein